MVVLITEAAGHENQHDRTLRALAEAKNWKQALVQAEKRLKKAKSDRVQINKALLQLYANEQKSHELAIASLESNLQAASLIQDNEVLHAIEGIAAFRPEYPKLRMLSSSLWEKVLKARPNDEGLLNELFERKVVAMEWDAARKLAMTRMKTKRDWYFRYIMCLHLSAVTEHSDVPNNMKAMNAGLAVKSLQKAAGDVVPDPDYLENPSKDPGVPGEVRLKISATSGKSIETQRELDLVIEVLKQQGKYQELFAILDDDTRTGVRSRIGGTFGTLKEKIAALRECKGWSMLWKVCDDLLRSLITPRETGPEAPFGRLVDDLGIWQAYLEAALELSGSDLVKLQKAIELASLAATKSSSQNARLASVNWGLQHQELYHRCGRNILNDCTDYLAEYCQKPFVFSQLRHSYRLSNAQKTEFLSKARTLTKEMAAQPLERKAASKAWLYAEINSLKFEYYLVVSKGEVNTNRKALFDAFIANCLKLYKLSFTLESRQNDEPVGLERDMEGPTDRCVGDDAALLAAMTMVHKYFLDHDDSLLRAAFIIETLLSHSKHNYDVVLFAVRLYVYMGQVARAFELFAGLDVKHVQNLSTLWILATRISTLHPHASRRLQCDPMEILDEATDWISGTQRSIKRALRECLSEKSYRNFVRTILTWESINTSISNVGITSEKSNIQWFSGVQPPLDIPIAGFVGHSYPDTRETRAFPNYEAPGQPTLEEMLRPGPLPQIRWCQSQQRLSAMRQIWQGRNLQAEKIGAISHLFSRDLDVRNGDEKEDSTAGELLEHKIRLLSFDLCMLACSMKGKGQIRQLDSQHSALIEDIRAICKSLSEESSIASLLPRIGDEESKWYEAFNWAQINAIYQRIYMLKFLLATFRILAIAERQWKVQMASDKEAFLHEAQNLENGAQRSVKRVKDWARAAQSHLKETNFPNSIVKKILEEPTGDHAVLDVLKGPRDGSSVFISVREFAMNLANGWIDLLDGIMAVDETSL